MNIIDTADALHQRGHEVPVTWPIGIQARTPTGLAPYDIARIGNQTLRVRTPLLHEILSGLR
jgi:hypothetical protein